MSEIVLTTVNEFSDWLNSKPKRGDLIIYYRGFLAYDRGKFEWTKNNREEDARTRFAWDMYDAGKVTLTQRRIGSSDYIYYADAK